MSALRRYSGILAGIAAVFALNLLAARAAFISSGAPAYIFALQNYNGTTSPPAANDPASFNTQVYGGPTPDPTQQWATASVYNGTSIDLTAAGNQPSGVFLQTSGSCPGFLYTNGSGCVAAQSVADHTHAFLVVQSWPFYVGPSGGTSSNVTAGTFSFQTGTDDGSYFVLAGAPFTFAQPGNFNNTTALVAGTAVVNNGGLHGPTNVYNSFSIPTTGQCGTNLYYLTFEYFEAVGGQAQIGYAWETPGTSTYVNPSMAVLYGQVLYNGAPDAGATVTVPLIGGGTATLTTDANGCYGYNYPSAVTGQTVAGAFTAGVVTATDTVAHGAATKTATNVSIPIGCTYGSASPCATYLEFDFPNPAPNITLYKRITKVVSAGVTTVPTPDPGPTGLGGTVKYAAGLKPGDTVTYTIFFSNAGSIPAQGPAGSGLPGPKITDVLVSSLSLQSVSAGVCCSNPTTSVTVSPSSSGNTATWQFAAPLPTANPRTPTTIQGSVSVTGTVK